MADDAKYLQKVPDDKKFRLSNGKSISNLEELYSAIRDSDENVFYHHVTTDRNDFANWIKYVIGSEDISAELSAIKNKEVFLGVLSDEITTLKNVQATAQPAAQQTAKPVQQAQPTAQPTSTQPSAQQAQSNQSTPQPPITTTQNAAIIVPAEDMAEYESILKNVIDEIEQEMFSWEG